MPQSIQYQLSRTSHSPAPQKRSINVTPSFRSSMYFALVARGVCSIKSFRYNTDGSPRSRGEDERGTEAGLAAAIGSGAGASSRRCQQRMPAPGHDAHRVRGYMLRFQIYGIKGRNDLPPIPRSHPMSSPPQLARRFVEGAPAHPSQRVQPAVRAAAGSRQATIGGNDPEQ